MSRYFIEQPSPDDVLGKRRELPNTSCVGVEFGPMNAVVYLRVSDHGLELFGDDSFMISPLATNHLQIIPREDHKRNSRIIDKQSDREDLRDAKLALERLNEMAHAVDTSSRTKTVAQRRHIADQIRKTVRCIERVI